MDRSVLKRGASREGGAIPRNRKLETRLLTSFLLLAFVPSLLLGIISTRHIADAIDRLQNPGVEASLSHSARLAQEWTVRVREDAERLLDTLPQRSEDAGGDEASIREILARFGFDFVAYEERGGANRVVARDATAPTEVVPESALPTANEWDLVASEGTPRPLAGATLRFFRPASGDTKFARAVGLTVEPDLAVALESAGGDYGRYLQLRLFEEIQKKLVWISMAGVLAVAAIAAYVVARVTARRISRPVRDLALAADRLATGDLSYRAHITADGEIGDLVAAFNRMSAQLEHSRDELIRMERIAAWRDVARRIAHEIRNPLTPIKVAIHRLERRLPADDETRECLRSIAEEVDSLARISTTFSEFAKLPEARFAPTDLAEVARSVVELFAGATPGVTVQYRGAASVPVVADHDQLRRACTNLVKNACEALGDRGTVTVAATREGDRAILRVADDGPGIPAEVRGVLFRPGVSTKAEGSGLGLAMVHRIASDHRGALRCLDAPPGAEFVFEFPIHPKESS